MQRFAYYDFYDFFLTFATPTICVCYVYNLINNPSLLYKYAQKNRFFYVLSSRSIRSRCARTLANDQPSSSCNDCTTSFRVSSSKKFRSLSLCKISSNLFFCESFERFEYCLSRYFCILFFVSIGYTK